jgi:hypothetical protein
MQMCACVGLIRVRANEGNDSKHEYVLAHTQTKTPKSVYS